MTLHAIPQQWLLGLLAGITIFLGLPVARIRAVSPKTKAFLNAISTGILIFLLVEIAGHLLEDIEELIERAATGQPGLAEALQHGGLFVLGFSIGLLGLVYFEQRWLGSAKDDVPKRRSKQVAMMIALGLGLHNFSEGLAIGQGYASGALQLAWLLAVGFALHNATEGFGIAAPLSGHQVSWGFLGAAGLVAGGPTFLGAVVGGWWINKPMEVFCLALASGTILYVVCELLHLGRQLKEEAVIAIGMLVGFFVAVVTDFVLVAALHQEPVRASQSLEHETTQAVVSTAPSAAVEQRAHKPLHGGYFGDADDLYHYEVLLNERRQLILYVNDELNRPMNARGLKGRWTINPDNPSPRMGVFHESPDGAYLIADLPPLRTDTLHVKVAVLKGRLWPEVEFYLPAAPARQQPS